MLLIKKKQLCVYMGKVKDCSSFSVSLMSTIYKLHAMLKYMSSHINKSIISSSLPYYVCKIHIQSNLVLKQDLQEEKQLTTQMYSVLS